MPRELPATESAELAEQLTRDLQGDSLNEKRGRAYAIIAEMERFAAAEREDWSASELAAGLVDSIEDEHTAHFVGRTKNARRGRLTVALKRIATAMRALRDREPFDICTLPEFLRRYGLQEGERVPFKKGIKIITGHDQDYHLKRAREKFDKLVEPVCPPNPDPEDFTIHRVTTQFDPTGEAIPEPLLIRFASPARWRNGRDQTTDDEWSFATDDLWKFWREATQKKIRRPHKN